VTPTAEAALRAMRRNARMALGYARDHARWYETSLVTDAIAKRVEEVAEAAKSRFPRALRVEYPQIAWEEMAGMRDRLALSEPTLRSGFGRAEILAGDLDRGAR